MKKILLVLSLLIFSFNIFSQAKANKTESKLDSIIQAKDAEIEKLKKEIEYYKQTLNLFNSKIESENKDVTFKINSIVGDTSTGYVTIEGILNNNGVIRSLQTHQTELIDAQGNTATIYDMSLGDDIRLEKLRKDRPVKFTVTIKTIIEGTPVIKSLTMKFHSSVGFKDDPIEVVFTNLSIDWN